MIKEYQEDINNLKVVSSNELIRAGFKLSKRALLFIFYLVAKLDSLNQDTFTDIFMHYNQIVAIVNYDGKRRISKRKEVFKIMDELNVAPIFREDCEEALQVNRLSSLSHNKKTDVFRLRIDPALEKYLLHLRECFTAFFYRYVLPMELPASIRLYALLKSYHSPNGVIEKIFEIEDLKFRL